MSENQVDTVTDLYAAIEDTIQRYPVGAAVGLFGVGIGVGALIGTQLMATDHRATERSALQIGRQVLQSMSEYLPRSLRG